ncbi:rhomboid family intramembrane serine protease [[Clostridium] spiroforme]|nr:rhomboid family intramembrane serine protease [Thomasclavelia spiroformis]MBM6879100.1 rhomboid family intramembrane serine protease [Thomasclavelia spiroformis]
MITLGFIGICILIFGLIQLDKSKEKAYLAIRYGAFYMPKIETQKEYWRFISANFVHVDIAHLFMNCYGIYYLGGTFFEPYLGSAAYLYLIAVAGIMSHVVTYVYTYYHRQYENVVTLGASGIFYGFLGAIVTLGLVYQGPFLLLLKQFALVIIINVAYTLFNKNISKTGHLGGFLGGVVATLILIMAKICVY